jgi:hypothetical protein
MILEFQAIQSSITSSWSTFTEYPNYHGLCFANLILLLAERKACCSFRNQKCTDALSKKQQIGKSFRVRYTQAKRENRCPLAQMVKQSRMNLKLELAEHQLALSKQTSNTLCFFDLSVVAKTMAASASNATKWRKRNNLTKS